MANLEFKKIKDLEQATSVTDEDLFIVETKTGTKSVNIGTFKGDAVTAESIGLGNVNNTSDIDKPISTATQKALDKKANAEDLPNIYLTKVDATDTYPTKVYSAETYLSKSDASELYVTKTTFDSTLNDIETLLQGV